MNAESWEHSNHCQYSGTPDDCLEKDPRGKFCGRKACNISSEDYDFANWKHTFEISKESQLLWNHLLFRDCLDASNSVVMRSNCKGCNRKLIGKVLWATENRNWNEAVNYCQQHGRVLFGQFGAVIRALMKTFIEMEVPLFDFSAYHTYAYTGGYQDGDILTWRSLETGEVIPYDDIPWQTDQPNNGVGNYRISMSPNQYKTNSSHFVNDGPVHERRALVCSIKNLDKS